MKAHRFSVHRPSALAVLAVASPIIAFGCAGDERGESNDLVQDDSAAVASDDIATAGAALAVTKTVRVLYIVPSNADRTDRASLSAAAMEHNRQTWSNYGATLHTEGIVTVHSAHNKSWFLTQPDGLQGNQSSWYWLGNACNEARTVYPEACTWDPNHKYVIFLELDITGVNNAAAAAGFGAAVLPKYILDRVEKGNLRAVGAVGHELGHTFGMPDPNCDSQEPTKNIMCNGGYYPHNRLNYLDYPFLFNAANQPYFEQAPSALFNIAKDKVLQGAVWKTQQGMTLDACASSCLADAQCSTFVHHGITCEFKSGTLSQTWSVPGYTSAEVKISKNGREVKEAGLILNNTQAQQVCPSVCAVWKGVPWTESSWTGAWWATIYGKPAACECDYNPDVNP